MQRYRNTWRLADVLCIHDTIIHSRVSVHTDSMHPYVCGLWCFVYIRVSLASRPLYSWSFTGVASSSKRNDYSPSALSSFTSSQSQFNYRNLYGKRSRRPFRVSLFVRLYVGSCVQVQVFGDRAVLLDIEELVIRSTLILLFIHRESSAIRLLLSQL